VKGIDGKPRRLQEGDPVAKDAVLAHVREADFLQRVASAKAQLAEAEAMKSQAQLDVDRAQKLVATQSVAQAQLDQAKVQIDAASARVQAAQALLREAELAVDDTRLRTPIDGVVFKRVIEVGSLVSPGAPAFSIADTRSVKASFGVPDVMVEKLKLGSELAILVEAVPGTEFTGKITRVSPSADPRSRVFEIETTVPNAKGDLKVGMIASLKVPGAGAAPDKNATPASVVPLNAVVRSPKDPNGFAVYVVAEEGDKQVVHSRDVQLGDALGNGILVTGGLALGDRVVVRGATLVHEGESVQVIP
jgi:multidrug efflux system membrane fusion protein